MIYKQPVTETQRRTALQNQANETALANLNAAIRNETTNRQNADSEINQNLAMTRSILNEEIAERSSDVAILRADLQTETSNRQAEDTNIRAALDLEIENRNVAESNLRNEINSAVDNEKTNRAQAISDLKSELEDAIDDEKNLRIAADNNLRADIQSETALRTAAINSVLNSLAAESTNRSTEDSRLAGLIATETTNRNNAINTAKGDLQNQLNTQNATIASLATKTYVDGQIAGVQENLSVFTAPTATTDGKQGQVPAPKKTSKMEILTNYGWRPADDTTLAINTLPSQSAPLTFNTGTLTPSWANFDAGKLTLSRGTTSGSSATSYTVYFKPIDIYLWSDTLDQQEKPVSWKIDKRPIIKPLESQREFDFGQSYDFSQFISNFDATYMNRPNNMSANTVGVHSYDITLKYPNDTYWGNNVNDTAKVTLTFEIKQRFLSAELSTGFAQAAPATFNGQNQTISITNTNSAYHTVTGNVQSNAGTFTAYVAPASGYEWDGGGTNPKPVTITIDKKAINRPKVTSDISFGYDGNAHSITTSGYDPSTMIESGDAKTQTAVGDYVLIYNLRDKNNYVWAETNDASEFKIDWNIGIKRLAYPSYDNTNPFVYSGEYKDLVVSGYDSDYMTSEGTVHEINAGTYTIKYHLTHPDRATWIGGATADYTLTWEIQRKPLTAAQSSGFSQSGTLYFNGTTQTPTINKFDATLHKLGGKTESSDAGTFTATVSPLDNYCWSDKTYAAKDVSWRLNGIKLLVRIFSSTETFPIDVSNEDRIIRQIEDRTYNSNEQTVVTSAVCLYYADTYYFNNTYSCTIAPADAFTVTGDNSATNAGDYTFTMTLKYPNNIQWYLESPVTSVYAAYVQKPIQVKWKIARQKLSAVTFSQNGILTYNAANQSVTINNFNEAYHVLGGDTTKKAAGNYTATVTPNANYCWNDGTYDSVNVPWSINKRVVNVPVAQETEFAYDGNRHELDFGNTYVTADMTRSGTYYATAAGNYTCTFALRDTANTRWSTGSSDNYPVEWSIGMTKIKIPVPGTTTFTFAEGTLRTPTFTVDEGVSQPTGDVNATNAGDYVITFALADSSTTVWEDGSTAAKSFNWKIKRKNLSATQSTFAQSGTINYDATAHTVTLTNYNSTYHSIGGDYTKTDAGTYAAIVTPLANYAWNDGTYGEKSVSWTINKIKIAKPVINGDADFLYDNQSHSPTINNYVADYMNVTGDTGNKSAVGEYKITYKLKSANNTTWSDDTTETVTLDWSIYKISVDKPLQTKSTFDFLGFYLVDDMRTHTFTDYVTGYDDSVMLQSGETSGVDAGTYTLRYALLNKLGYQWSDGTTADAELQFTINQAPIEDSDGGYLAYSDNTTYTGAAVNAFESTMTMRTTPTVQILYRFFKSWRTFKASGVAEGRLTTDAVTITGETSGTDAKTYTVEITPTANYHWRDTKTQEGRQFTWTINRAEITAPSIDSAVTLTYNENSQSPTLLNFDADKMEIVSGDSATDAGDYQLAIRPKGNYCWAADDTRDIEAGSTETLYLSWTIERQPLSEGLSTLFYYGGAIQYSKAQTYAEKGLQTKGNSVTFNLAYIKVYDENYTYTSGNSQVLCYITHNKVAKFYTFTGTTSASAVGSYVFYIAPSANYCWADGSIAPKEQKWYRCPTELSVPKFSNSKTNFDFDGAEHTVTFSKEPSVTVTATTTITEVNSMFSRTSATAAGTYTLTFHCPAGKIWAGTHSWDNPAGDNSDYVLTWTIGETNITVVDKPYLEEDATTSFVYDGNEKTLAVQGIDSTLMNVTGYLNATNAGTFTVTINPKSNVVWAGGGNGQIQFNWEITRKPLTSGQSNLRQTPGNVKSFLHDSKYVGTEQTVVISGFNALYHEVVSGDKATNAGDYICIVKVKDNYCWADGTIANKSISWKIKKGTLSVPELSATELEYTGSAQAPTLNVTNAYLVNFSGDELSQTICGNYSRTLALKDTTNWQWRDETVTSKTVSWKITPKFLTIPAATSTTTFTYLSNTARSLTIDGFDSTTMDSDGTISEINAGDYSVTYSLKDLTNYRWDDGTTAGTLANQTISWTIKRAITLQTLAVNQTYNGSEKSLWSVTNWGKDQIVDGVLHKSDKYYRGTFYETNAGTYTFYVKPDENHYWKHTTYGSAESIAERQGTFTIEKAPCEITTDADSYTITDADFTGAWGTGVISKSISVSSTGDGEFSQSTTNRNVAYLHAENGAFVTIWGEKNGIATITIKQAESDNYLPPPDKIITVIVERTIQTLIWPSIKNRVADGTLLEYTSIGDSKTITLKGTVGNLTLNGTYRAVLIGYDHNLPTESDGATHTAHFAIMKNADDSKFIAFCSSDYGSTSTDWSSFIHTPQFSATSWAESNLRTGIGEDFNALLKAQLGSFWIDGIKKGSVNETNCADEIWTFSATELALNADYGIGRAYEYFADGNNPTFYRHDNENQAVEVWTRQYIFSQGALSGMYTYTTNSANRLGSAKANKSLGFIPCFIIG